MLNLKLQFDAELKAWLESKKIRMLKYINILFNY
jgi:hypothetical protein